MTDRDVQLPSDDERSRDRELIAALEEHESISERYHRTGEVALATRRDPSMAPSPESESPRDPTPVQPAPRPPRFVGRTVLRILIVVAALLVLYSLVSLWQVWSTGRSDDARPVDAIVVMGAAQYDGRPSPQLAARLDHAIDLWNEELAPVIIVTGGKQPTDRFTEAEASADYLVANGAVPSEVIRMETAGASTYESFQGVRDLVAASGEPVDSVLIVTDPYHALRSKLIAEDLGFDAYVSPTTASVVTGTREIRRELMEAAGVAVGRIIGFDRLSGLTD